MKWIKWSWPLLALLAVAVYYAVGTFIVLPNGPRVPRHPHRHFWPFGRLGIVLQVFWYGTFIVIATAVVVGAAVAIFMYLRQNKPPRGDSAQNDG